MSHTDVTTSLNPPRIGMTEEVFNQTTYQFLADIITYSTELNNTKDYVNSSAEDIDDDLSNSQTASANIEGMTDEILTLLNFDGPWSAATGAKVKGQSFLHEEMYFILNENVADITAENPLYNNKFTNLSRALAVRLTDCDDVDTRASQNYWSYGNTLSSAVSGITHTNINYAADDDPSPFSVTDADFIGPDATNGLHTVEVETIEWGSFSDTGSNTVSFYLKNSGADYLKITFGPIGLSIPESYFDVVINLNGMQIHSQSEDYIIRQKSIGNYVRYTITMPSGFDGVSLASVLFTFLDDSLSDTFSGDGVSGVWFFGGQAEERHEATALMLRDDNTAASRLSIAQGQTIEYQAITERWIPADL